MFTRRLVVNTLCEFGPVLVFFAVYALLNFPSAVIGMVTATCIAFLALMWAEGHAPLFALISSGSIIFFGVLSLVLSEATVFILRDTLFNIFMGCVLIASVLKNKPLFKLLFANVFAITDRGWNALSMRWGIFFLVLAVANEVARSSLSPEQWVTFKAGIVVACIIFGSYQFTLTRRERLPDATPWGIVK